MIKGVQKSVSLGELAKELKVNKSSLHYWVSRGVLTPTFKIGGMFIFPKAETIALLKKVKKMQEKGLTLEEIIKLIK